MICGRIVSDLVLARTARRVSLMRLGTIAEVEIGRRFFGPRRNLVAFLKEWPLGTRNTTGVARIGSGSESWPPSHEKLLRKDQCMRRDGVGGVALGLILWTSVASAGEPAGKIVEEYWDAAYLESAHIGFFHTTVRQLEKDGKKTLQTTLE